MASTTEEKPETTVPGKSQQESRTTDAAQLDQDSSPDPSKEAPNGTVAAASSEEIPRKTPFELPASSVSIPPTEPLTTEQETSYNSLLNSVSSWTLLPNSKPVERNEPLTESERMWLTRDCLLRYLRASKWSVSTAKDRLAATLQWRRTYGLTALPPSTTPKITAEYVSPENETGKQWIQGFDNNGRPCLYLNPSRQNTPRSDRQLEHLVFMLERLIDITPPGQETVALLINFADTKNGQGASVSQGKQTLNILQNHYPERLGRALLCNRKLFLSYAPSCIANSRDLQSRGISGPS